MTTTVRMMIIDYADNINEDDRIVMLMMMMMTMMLMER